MGAAGKVSRRTLLGSSAAGLVGAWLAGTPAWAAPARRPNILCLISEDCSAAYLGAYGGIAETPVIDRLASDGVRWANCFSAAPVCAPSRFAMVTGLPAESCGPAEEMRAMGRMPAALANRGWPALLREAGYYCTNNAKEDYNAPIDVAATWDASHAWAHWRNRPAGAPFFAIFNPQITHESNVFYAEADEQETGGRVRTPPTGAADAVHAYAGTPIVGGPTNPADVRIPPYSPDTPTTRADMAKYHNLINQMDAELGRRLAELEADSVADDTIVLYYSDHAGVLLRSKRFCYDSGLHIPLIARFGKNVAHLAPAPPGSVLTTPVNSGLDLPVTILTLAGLGAPSYMPGVAFAGPRRATQRYAFSMRNRMDERNDMVRTVRDERYRYIRNYMPHLRHGQHIQFMWEQAGYREWEQGHLDGTLDHMQDRFWRERAAEELYDLRRDQDEVSNLVDDPRHAQVLDRLRRALDGHMLAVNDNGFIPEGSSLAGYDASREPAAYPLAEVMQLAATAIERDPANVPVFVEHLGAANEVLRYWAALGCCMLGERAGDAREALDRVFRDDASVQVRIVAAEALARLGVTGETVAFLGDTLDNHPNTYVQLQAADALENIGDAATPALPQLIAAQKNLDPATTIDQYPSEAARYTARKLSGTYWPSP
jgi:arylsulfatase A-like enzyme